MTGRDPVMPSEVTDEVGKFDQFAERTDRIVSSSWFFLSCVALVVIWLPSGLFLDVSLWELLINTVTTIITFLMVGLAANATRRAMLALNHKLNALAHGNAAQMRALAALAGGAGPDLEEARRELCAAVGLEEKEST